MKITFYSYRHSTYSRRLTPTWRLACVAAITVVAAVMVGYTATVGAPAALDRFIPITPDSSNKKQERSPGELDRLLLSAKLREPVSLRFVSPLLDPVVYTDKVNYFPGEWA